MASLVQLILSFPKNLERLARMLSTNNYDPLSAKKTIYFSAFLFIVFILFVTFAQTVPISAQVVFYLWTTASVIFFFAISTFLYSIVKQRKYANPRVQRALSMSSEPRSKYVI